MKIRKGWSKGVKRWLGTVLAEGTACRSRSTFTHLDGSRSTRYTLELSNEADGSSLGVELSGNEVMNLILTAKAVDAMQACERSGIDYPKWLETTWEILGCHPEASR